MKESSSRNNDSDSKKNEKKSSLPCLQNRELSWLVFNERVLNLGLDTTIPLLDRLNFVSIFWSNLQEFFMVRVGSLTDLSLVKKEIRDSKTYMTPKEQLSAIYLHCVDLYTNWEATFTSVRQALAENGIHHLRKDDLNDKQVKYLDSYMRTYVLPVLSPQIVNPLHPFPHLENGMIYIVVRLNEESNGKEQKKKNKNARAQGVTLGFIPLPHMCDRIIVLPGEKLQFILLEDAIEMYAAEIFSMYHVKHTNIICVTRNADLDASEGIDEDVNYREHMKRILKKRSRLAPVRLESTKPLTPGMEAVLLSQLNLEKHQSYCTNVPLDMSYTYSLADLIGNDLKEKLTHHPFAPQWPDYLNQSESMLDQASKREMLMFYPYHSMEPFVQLLREAAWDPSVISIKITLYRLARQSHLAEALIAAAENGKEVTVLCELRARFDEKNNIDWSQRFEEAGCNVIYGFKNLKVHSKICFITRRTENGIEHITQLGTGNYNEKTARLYTDMSFITSNESIGRDAVTFFRNLSLETVSDEYETLWVAPLQIKQNIVRKIDEQMELAKEGKPCGIFFKTNSVTDKELIEKIIEASQANVPIVVFVRGICCLIPGIPGFTENITVMSIVGRLLEHSRIYGFGPMEDMELYLSSADIMTRNMDKRIEIAWPVLGDEQRKQILDYITISLNDTAKLRRLLPDRSYTPLKTLSLTSNDDKNQLFDSQNYLITTAGKPDLIEKAKKKDKKKKGEKKANRNDEVPVNEQTQQEEPPAPELIQSDDEKSSLHNPEPDKATFFRFLAEMEELADSLEPLTIDDVAQSTAAQDESLLDEVKESPQSAPFDETLPHDDPILNECVTEESHQEEIIEDGPVEEEIVEEEAVEEDSAQEKVVEEEVVEDEAVEDEAVQEEIVEDETPQEEAVQEEALQEESVREETVEEEGIEEETLQEEAALEKAVQEEPVQEAVVEDEVVQEEVVEDETLQENPTEEELVQVEPTQVEPSLKEIAPEEATEEETTSEETVSEEAVPEGEFEEERTQEESAQQDVHEAVVAETADSSALEETAPDGIAQNEAALSAIAQEETDQHSVTSEGSEPPLQDKTDQKAPDKPNETLDEFPSFAFTFEKSSETDAIFEDLQHEMDDILKFIANGVDAHSEAEKSNSQAQQAEQTHTQMLKTPVQVEKPPTKRRGFFGWLRSKIS